MFSEGILFFYTLIYLLAVSYYFGHHGRPAPQIFNLHLLIDYLNQTILLIKNKLHFRRFKVGLGTKAAKIADFKHLNFTFGH